MSIYTVHEPPLRGTQSEPDPNRFIFVRDGFSFWAFLIPALWMLRHRLWLVLVVYLGIAILLQAGLHAIGASFSVRLATSALLHLFVGLEAATLRRITLARRRLTNIGVVVGDDPPVTEALGLPVDLEPGVPELLDLGTGQVRHQSPPRG